RGGAGGGGRRAAGGGGRGSGRTGPETGSRPAATSTGPSDGIARVAPGSTAITAASAASVADTSQPRARGGTYAYANPIARMLTAPARPNPIDCSAAAWPEPPPTSFKNATPHVMNASSSSATVNDSA